MNGPEEAARDHPFRLNPQEQFLFGVTLKGDTLRFGPAGGALVLAVVAAVVAVIIAVCLVFVEFDALRLIFWEVGPVVGQAIGIGIALAALAHQAARLRSGTRVGPETVEIRSLLGRVQLSWETIVGTRIVEDRPAVPFDIGIGGDGGGFRSDVDSSKAYLVCANGSRHQLTGFEGSAKTKASAEFSTATEVKVGALRRYRETTVGPWPTKGRTPRSRE